MPRRHLSTAMPSSVSAWLARGAAVLALSCGACATTSVTQQTLPNHELANVGVTRVQRAPAMRDRAIQQVAYQDGLGPNCPPEAITSCPPDPRMPLGGPLPYGVGMPICDAACQPSPHHYPDEYLCDGGDREWPVHYYEDERHGLDTEDTVAEFTDHKGKERTSKSNKVCVYSPRFASVRTVSLPHEEGTIVEVAKTENTTGGNEVRTRMAATLRNKNIAVGGVAMRSRASGLEGEVLHDTKSQRQRPHMHDKVLNLFQDLVFIQSGTLEQGDLARLGLGIQAAQHWTREQDPVIQGKTEKVNIGLSEIRATALTVIDDLKSDKPGQLRVVKVADKDTAEVDDIVTFTIRYDNLGPREVTSVRIVDNLTPRLEYVDDSATSDRAGKLVVQDNGEGSLVLIWEFDDALPEHTGGTVTFQTRVR